MTRSLRARSLQAVAAASAMLVVTSVVLTQQFTPPALAQVDPAQDNICPELVLQAIDALETNCNDVGRNEACYGNTLVSATFTEEKPDGYFSAPAERADLVTLQSIQTAALDSTDARWGIALMSMQANMPGSLPGQSVNFILFGDATVVNTVPPDEAALPVEPIAVTTTAAAIVRTQPQSTANLAGTAPAAAPLLADGIDPTGRWVRISYVDPSQPNGGIGGWVPFNLLNAFDSTALPVITEQTRTPMQAFVFRTGLFEPECQQAPNQVLIQGPQNTQINLNVNGADIVVGSTVTMTSVSGAPDEIIDQLDLPPEIEDQLTDGSTGGTTPTDDSTCGVMQLTVLNGEVLLNDEEVTLPEGNHAYSVYCGEPDAFDRALDPESTPEPEGSSPVDFASDWGAFRTMTEEEIEAQRVVEQITESVIQYEIDLPDPNDIQPVIINTPEPTQVAQGSTPAATSTPSGTPTPAPTARPPGSGVASNIQVDQFANNQVAVVGQPFPIPFSVRVYDVYGAPASGVPVTFSAPASGPSGTFASSGTNTMVAFTDDSGTATASPFTGNTQSGSYTVTVTAPTQSAYVTGKGDAFAKPAQQEVLVTFTVANAAGTPTTLAISGGDGQSAMVGTGFASLLSVRLTDQYGNPAPGVTVTFTAPIGGATGTFSSGSSIDVVTDSSGIASAALTANTTAGGYSIVVTSGSLITTFGVSNVLPVLSISAGDGQSVEVGSAFPTALQVTLTNPATGAGVAGQNVTFSLPGSGASAVPGGSLTQVTDGSGRASLSLTANTISGSYSVGASSIFGTNVSFSLTNTPGPADAVVILSGDGQSTTVGTAFAQNLVSEVRDAFGNSVGAGTTVTYIQTVSTANGTLGSLSLVTNAFGQVINTATANTVSGVWGVIASVSGGSTSASYTLTNTPDVPVSMSVVSGTPQTATVNTNFAQPLVVNLVDQYSNPVPGVTVTFSAPVITSSARFVCTGTETSTAVSDATGTATSCAVQAKTVAAGSYTVTASAGALSQNFLLTNQPGAPASITRTLGDGQSATVTTTYGSALQVRVEDAFGNDLFGVGVTFSAGVGGNGQTVTFGGPATVLTNASGLALSPLVTANNKSGTVTVTASVGALNTAFSLTNLPGAPATMTKTAGDGQSTTVGTPFATQLQVQVLDAFANAVPSASVTFTAPGSGASGTFAGFGTVANVSSNASGFATAPVFTANGTGGAYSVTVSSGAASTSFNLTNDVPACCFVTNFNDSGPGSLRQAVIDVSPGGTIQWLPGLTGTITFGSQIDITKSMTIVGNGANVTRLSGNNATRLFSISGAGVNVTFQAMQILNGFGNGFDGGAVYLSGGATLTLDFMWLSNNVAGTSGCCGKGGFVFVEGATLVATNSVFSNNTAGSNPANNYGGAITLWSSGASVTVTNSCLIGNVDAASPSNAIFNYSGININATNNWWGDAGGPGANGVNRASGAVTTTPFATSPLGLTGC